MYRIINLKPCENRSNYFLNKLEDVSILIKTLERKAQLINLLHSIRKYKFKGPVIIADDSKIPYEKEILNLFPELKITYLSIPYDTGTAEGRNIMIQHTKTTYIVLCDDDFIFESRTRIPLMRNMLIENNLDILAGVFFEYMPKTIWEYRRRHLFEILIRYNYILPPNQIYEYFANLEITKDICKIVKVNYVNPFTICDLAHNFFIAKTESIRKIKGWNPILKGGEHQNFFIRAKFNNLKVATSRKFGVIHDKWTPNSEAYKRLRERGIDYQNFALAEFGIKEIVNYSEVLGGQFANKLT
jgi:glycosyltransferase involved in cell wall biosynthesis